MTTITTYNGITLGLVEVEKDAYDFKIKHKKLNYRIIDFACDFDIEIKGNYELIGTTSTLTDEQVEPFVELLVNASMLAGGRLKQYKNYKFNKPLFDKPLESWNSLLEANGFDLSKEYVILKLNK